MVAKSYGFKEAQAVLRDLNRKMQANMALATKENAIHSRNALVLRITNGDPSWPKNSSLTISHKGSSKQLNDHGDLRMSVRAIPVTPTAFFIGIPKGVEGKDGFPMWKRAASLEFGVIINPRKAKMLALPTSREADRLIRQYGGIRNIPGLFRPRGAGGRWWNILCLTNGKGQLVTLFILKRQVTIPPYPLVGPVIQEEMPVCLKRWEAAAKATLQGKAYRVQLT